jgi:hypothetical protein
MAAANGADGASPAAEQPAQATEHGRGAGFRLGFDSVTLRALFTNFDVGLIFLVVATLVDLRFGPWELGGVAFEARAAWLVFYAVVLPLDFLDHVRTYLRRGHFASETQRLLVLAHHYRMQAEPDESRERPAGS